MNCLLSNKVVLIIGGAGLLGKHFAKSIMKNGGKVIVADINLSLCDGEFPDNYFEVLMDINNGNSLSEGARIIYQKFKKIDSVVNCAYPKSTNYGAKLEDVKYDEFCKNLNINLAGAFQACQFFCNFFEKQGFGNFINIGSIYGSITPKFEIYNGTSMTMPVEYAAIKSGLIHMTRYFAKYYKGKNIRINCLSPGGIKDNQPDNFKKEYFKHCNIKGLLDAEDIFGTLLFLLSDNSMYITGQNIIVDDGFSL